MRPPTVCNYINSTLCHPPFSLAEGGDNTSHCDKTPVCGIGKAEFTDFFLGGCDALWIELLLYPGDKPLEEKEISNQREKKKQGKQEAIYAISLSYLHRCELAIASGSKRLPLCEFLPSLLRKYWP
jgi:hypothetical protein